MTPSDRDQRLRELAPKLDTLARVIERKLPDLQMTPEWLRWLSVELPKLLEERERLEKRVLDLENWRGDDVEEWTKDKHQLAASQATVARLRESIDDFVRTHGYDIYWEQALAASTQEASDA